MGHDAHKSPLRAPAKLNLWLRLTGEKRADGRHELRSHFAPLALADYLRLTPANRLSLRLSGPFAAGVPDDDRNLVWRAFTGFTTVFGEQAPMHIHIEKNIPHGAGLGGGSSDAGALLSYLARQAGIPLNEVCDWSVTLGADIPAMIEPRSILVSGVGEICERALPMPKARVLLVKTAATCSTGEVFQAWDPNRPRSRASQNDLEAAAIQICPEIATILTYLRATLDPQAQMTGSGSACFALLPVDRVLSPAELKVLAPYWTCLTDFAPTPSPG